jgi:hypothetical protein
MPDAGEHRGSGGERRDRGERQAQLGDIAQVGLDPADDTVAGHREAVVAGRAGCAHLG